VFRKRFFTRANPLVTLSSKVSFLFSINSIPKKQMLITSLTVSTTYINQIIIANKHRSGHIDLVDKFCVSFKIELLFQP